jgi:hypothetical protein
MALENHFPRSRADSSISCQDWTPSSSTRPQGPTHRVLYTALTGIDTVTRSWSVFIEGSIRFHCSIVYTQSGRFLDRTDGISTCMQPSGMWYSSRMTDVGLPSLHFILVFDYNLIKNPAASECNISQRKKSRPRERLPNLGLVYNNLVQDYKPSNRSFRFVVMLCLMLREPANRLSE